MSNDKNHVDISDGIEISSLSSYSQDGNGEDVGNKEDSKNGNSFKDLEETNFEEKINLSSTSGIDAIEFTGKDDFFPEIFIKKYSSGNQSQVVIEKSDVVVELETEEIGETAQIIEETTLIKEDVKPEIKTGKVKKSKDKKNRNIENLKVEKTAEIENVNEVGDAEELEPVEDLEVSEVLDAEEVLDENYDEITPLINRIDKEHDTVEFPGKISLIQIDKKLSNPELEIEESSDTKVQDTEEVFGIKRAEVFYTIDKKIYSSRRSQNRIITKLKNLKNGLFLPMMVVAISVIVLSIAIPLILVYLNMNSSTSLEENFISDNSILAQIAKQKEEEARLAKIDLEEKMKNLEFEKTQIQSTINEELLKRQTEIENDYQKRLKEIENKGGSQKQVDLLKQQLEDEKNNALLAAKSDSDRKIDEQQKILDQKNKELLDADSKLSEAIKNKNFEISQLTKNLEDAIKVKDAEAQNISQKLLAISETNKKIKEFNQVVYQMISGAIDDFKNDNKDSSLTKLENVVKYYNSRIEFVNANEELSSKMSTDFAFIQTITGLIDDSKNSLLYNSELVRLMNKFKRITDNYKNAEINYARNDFFKSSEDYAKVLGEIDEVNQSFNRLKQLEKQIQNAKAVGYYNQAISDMKDSKYELAVQELASVIRETPISDYANQALGDIVTLSGSMSASSKTLKSNEQARDQYNKAGEYSKNKLYKEAINSYQSVIVNYPFSDYIKDSLKNIIDLQSIVSQNELGQMDDKLRENFRTDYTRYLELSKSGNMAQAREYYFSALKNAFNLYSENSIPDFKSEEDKYIAALLNKNNLTSSESIAKQIEDAKANLSRQYDSDIAKLKKQYEDQITLLKNNNTGKASQEELDKIKSSYEAEIAKKSGEIESLKKEYEARIALLKKESGNTSSQEEAGKLKVFYEAELDKKNKEISKLNSDLKNATSSAVAVSENDLKKEQENVAKLKQQLFDLYKRYSKLEIQLRDTGDTGNTGDLNALQKKYDLLQNELDVSRNTLDVKTKDIEKKAQDEIKRQVDIEKDRLQRQFADQIKALANQNSTSVKNDASKNGQLTIDIENLQNKYIARVIEVIDDSITFQFLSNDLMKNLKNGDKLKISRLTKNSAGEYIESVIGDIRLVSINDNSLFGRGKVSASLKNIIQVNDLIKK